jgi:hypothetical protein
MPFDKTMEKRRVPRNLLQRRHNIWYREAQGYHSTRPWKTDADRRDAYHREDDQDTKNSVDNTRDNIPHDNRKTTPFVATPNNIPKIA